MTGKSPAMAEDSRAVFAGRIDILYALGRHYLSLPFAVLCVPATLLAGNKPGILPFIPLLIQMVVVIAAEQLTTGLAEACAAEKWDEAARLAQDIVGAAGGLGLTAVTQAVRGFAQKSRDGGSRHDLRNAAQLVVGEHLRAKQALMHLHPDVA